MTFQPLSAAVGETAVLVWVDRGEMSGGVTRPEDWRVSSMVKLMQPRPLSWRRECGE
jgi:hypothetical protein